MEQQTLIADIERRANLAGVTMGSLCREAGIHPTTFSRWKQSERNPNPVGALMTSLNKLQNALAAAEASGAQQGRSVQ